MDLVFGMEMPADRVEGIAMRPCLEGFAAPYLDDLQVRFHLVPSGATRFAACALFPAGRIFVFLGSGCNFDATGLLHHAPPRFRGRNDTFLTSSTYNGRDFQKE
jgi:hypothetical protein